MYTYIHFFKPIILTQEPQKHRNSSKSLIRKFSPLQSFLFEKAKLERDYQILNAAQRSQSKELVISGLQISDTTSSKSAVYAALKLLDGGLLERDPKCTEDVSETALGAADLYPIRYTC